MNDQSQSTDHEAKKDRLTRFGRWWANTRELAGKVREAPFQSSVVSLVFVVLGWIGQDVYGWARSLVISEEDYIERLSQEQRKGFEDLQASLNALRGEVGGGALGEVRDAVRALERANAGNLDKLRLANRENELLRRSLEQTGKVTGGYDVLLSENESVQLDPGTILGITNLRYGSATVTLTSPQNVGTTRPTGLLPGEALPFVRRTGEKCSVALLSLREGVDAASFAVNCEESRRA